MKPLSDNKVKIAVKEPTFSSSKPTVMSAMDVMIRPDRLQMNKQLATMLMTVYDLHTAEDLVEIVYAYRIHESITFLENHLSLDNDYLRNAWIDDSFRFAWQIPQEKL